MTPRFDAFAAIDWSGATGERQKGIAVALCQPGDAAPVLVEPSGGWSRQRVLDWLLDHARNRTRIVVGLDLSPAFPFVDRGAYFPSQADSPPDGPSLWAYVEQHCAGEAHLGANSFLAAHGRHFRLQRGREVLTGDLFEGTTGRLRVVEAAWLARRVGRPTSSFNLIGAAQVGKASLTGMRLLHRLDDTMPLWPFAPVPASGPLLVEIYTSIAARAAGMAGVATKVRNAMSLDAALAVLESRPHLPLARYDDHATDAIISAAWLRRTVDQASYWHPSALTPKIARTEGWTFGVT